MSSPLRYIRSHMGILSSTILVLTLMVLDPARGTVLEYDTTGTLTVKAAQSETELATKTDEIATRSNENSILRELTRDVAIRYSGTTGVRRASLDALSFMEVFELLIERESAFNPLAVSEKGAQGLGQLMPDTAKDMGVKNPLDPLQNLNGSAKYFTSLLERFGRLDFALAAYNAGPERIKQYDGIPPFKETQAYVTWIMSKAGIEQSKNAAKKVATPHNQKPEIDPPLKGDVSVWEF